MDLRFYNPELELQGVMDTQKSVVWRRKLHEPGEFTIICPITPFNTKLVQLGHIIWFEGSPDAGVIENIQFTQQAVLTQIRIKGRFLTSYLDRRLIRPQFTYDGPVEDAMRYLVSNLEYPLPLVELGEHHGYEEEIEFQATYKNLLTYMTMLSKASNIGYRFRPDFTARKIYFETFKGVDHSVNQSERTRVVFSPEYRNLNKAEWERDDSQFKNVCYAGGQGEYPDRVYAIAGDDESRGLERREMYSNQSSIKRPSHKDKYGNVIWDMTEEEYQKLLRAAGEEALLKYQSYDTFEAECIPFGNFTYKVDYDLGDVVTVIKPDWGIEVDERMREITEVYEHGAATLEPVFGTPFPETIDWEDK